MAIYDPGAFVAPSSAATRSLAQRRTSCAVATMAGVLDTFSWRSETLTRALVARTDCDILAELIVLRDQVSGSERADQHFEKERDNASKCNERARSFAQAHENAMEDMNRRIWIPRTFNFLDLGCCPGGYSSYLLRKNRRAKGIGISLPTELGGKQFAITYPEYLSRYKLHLADLAAFDLAPGIPKPASPVHKLHPLPFEPASQDLVVCDCQWVLNPDNLKRAWNWTRLIISQLLIALRAVSPGGNIFLRLSCVERTLTGRILLALCRISDLVRTVKSSQFQAVRSCFYVLAQRIDPRSEECQKLVAALERLWYVMSFEGNEGYGRDIGSDDEELITTEAEMTSERGLSVLVQLGTPVWNVQYDALCWLSASRGV